MNKTKGWKWMLIIGVLILAAYQISISTKAYEHPARYEIQGFPLIEQPDQITCGPTSIAMVMKHYGITQTINEIKSVAKTEWFKINGQKIGGTSPEYVKIAMNKLGIPSSVKSGDVKKLKHYVSQNRPPIVLVRSSKQTWHYVVVIGYTSHEIIIADPGWGRRRVIPLGIFKDAWEFTSDLRGTDMTIACKVCGGDGEWWTGAGPLGKCGTCNGTGIMPDLFKILVELGDARGYTMIVPKEPFHENQSDLPNQRQQLPKVKTSGGDEGVLPEKLLGSVCE